MLDLKVGCLAFEECHDRVGDRLQDRFVALAVRLDEILPDRYAREIGLALQSCPRFVGPRDDPVRVEDRDRATLQRSEEHTSELQSPMYLVCRPLLEKIKAHDSIY